MDIYNELWLGIDADGTKSVSVSSKPIWRKAIDGSGDKIFSGVKLNGGSTTFTNAANGYFIYMVTFTSGCWGIAVRSGTTIKGIGGYDTGSGNDISKFTGTFSNNYLTLTVNGCSNNMNSSAAADYVTALWGII